MTAILVVSYLVGAAVLFDALRRPAASWVAADRERGFWLGVLGALSVFGLGLVAAALSLCFLVPAFARTASAHSGDFQR